MSEEELLFEILDQEDSKLFELYEKNIISYNEYLELYKKIIEKI